MEPSFKAGDLLEDRFSILEELGTGGTATVFLANDGTLDRKVAVKVLHERLAERSDLLQRFKREAFALTRLQHPGILTVYRFGLLAGGAPYLVTEFIQGESLRDVLARQRYNCTEAAQAVLEIADALEHAHRAGVIHRDLKPENIMVERDRDRLRLKILDFGLCKTEDALKTGQMTITQPGATVGTPPYMSPEQCLGQVTDLRTDIYSLGCVFFELVAGVKAFERQTVGMAMLAHLNDPVPQFSDVDSINSRQLPELAQRIVDRCLCKNKEKRYQSMSALREDLVTLVKSNSKVQLISSSEGTSAANACGTFSPEGRPVLGWIAGMVAVLAIFGTGLVLFTDGGNRLVVEEIQSRCGPQQATSATLQWLSLLQRLRGRSSASAVAIEASNSEKLSSWSPADRIRFDRSLVHLFAADREAQLQLEFALLEHSYIYMTAPDGSYPREQLKPAEESAEELMKEFVLDKSLSSNHWVRIHDIVLRYHADRAPATRGLAALTRLYGEATWKFLGDKIDIDQASDVCRYLLGAAIIYRQSTPAISDEDWHSLIQRSMDLAYKLKHLKRAGWAHVEMAHYCLHHAQLQEAEQHIRKAEELDELVGLSGGERGSLAEAKNLLAKAERASQGVKATSCQPATTRR